MVSPCLRLAGDVKVQRDIWGVLVEPPSLVVLLNSDPGVVENLSDHGAIKVGTTGSWDCNCGSWALVASWGFFLLLLNSFLGYSFFLYSALSLSFFIVSR